MSMPFYVSPEQVMADKAEFARKGISRGKSSAILTRSPLIVAIRITPIGFFGSPMTTSSPSLRVITSIMRASCRHFRLRNIAQPARTTNVHPSKEGVELLVHYQNTPHNRLKGNELY